MGLGFRRTGSIWTSVLPFAYGETFSNWLFKILVLSSANQYLVLITCQLSSLVPGIQGKIRQIYSVLSVYTVIVETDQTKKKLKSREM